MTKEIARDAIVGSWWIFGGVGILLAVYGIYAFLLPSVDPTHWTRNGLVKSSEASEYVAHTFRWLGILATMVGFLTAAVAYWGFRTGSRAAWFGFLGYPIFFAFAIAFTWPSWAWSPFLRASLFGLWDFRSTTRELTKLI